MRKFFLSAISASALFCAPASADIISDMGDFWDRSGGGANVTRPTAFTGQSAGYATAGSLYIRTQARNSTVAQLTLPNLRAGCGGIDIFTGAFSFLSKEELIAMSKAIAANAAGFAFQLALESISPSVAKTVAELRDLAQQVNNMNISSCETAASLVGGIWPATDTASRLICESIGNDGGIFSDWVGSRHGCGAEGKQVQTLNGASGPLEEQRPLNINYAWRALKKNAFFATEDSLAEVFMTMTGTIIVRAPTGENGSPRRRVLEARAFTAQTLEAFTEGGRIRVYKCGDTTNCLTVTQENITIEEDEAFFAQVRGLIEAVDAAIESDAAVPAPALALLNLSNIPIFKALTVARAYNHHFTSSEIALMAEAVALDIAIAYMREMAKEVALGAGAIDVPGPDIENFQNNLRDTINQLAELSRKGQDGYEKALQSLQRLRIAEGALAANGATFFASQFRAK